MDEIRQDGKTVLSGSNGVSIPMFGKYKVD